MWEFVDWLHLIEGRKLVACFCENDNEPSGSIKDGEFLVYFSDD
jgi:hypothetical protein